MSSSMRLTVHRDRCVGSSQCLGIAPDHMQLDDEGIAMVVSRPVPADLADELVGSCPTGALFLSPADAEAVPHASEGSE